MTREEFKKIMCDLVEETAKQICLEFGCSPDNAMLIVAVVHANTVACTPLKKMTLEDLDAKIQDVAGDFL